MCVGKEIKKANMASFPMGVKFTRKKDINTCLQTGNYPQVSGQYIKDIEKK